MISSSALVIGVQLASSLAVMALPMPYGPMMQPYYGGMMPMGMPMYPGPKQMVYQKQMADGSNFYGGNQGFSGYENNGMGQDVVRDNKQIVNQGAQGVRGNHMVMKGNQGGQGYQHNMGGAKYNQGGDGYVGGQKIHDVSSKDGYGGFGNLGHKKGHRTTGFHKTYHNIESGKDSKYVDEDHDEGEQNFGKEFDKNFDDRAWDQYDHGQRGGSFGEHVNNNAGGGGGMKAVGVQDRNWDARDHNGYSNNRDLAYQRAHVQANRKNDHGMGHTAGRGGVGGSYYMAPHMG